MEIKSMVEALDLVGNTVKIKSAKHFSDKKITNGAYLKNVYANFQSKKCEVLNYKDGSEGNYRFELFNGKKVAYFSNDDFELVTEPF